jgi:hypothetical protein
MLCEKIKKNSGISAEDKLLLEKYAPLFGVTFTANAEGTHTVSVCNQGNSHTCIVSSRLAHLRLLAELCEKLIPWVYFGPREHCSDTLFSMTEMKIQRLAQLYALAQAKQSS